MKNIVKLSSEEIFQVVGNGALCRGCVRTIGYGLSGFGFYLISYARTFPEVEILDNNQVPFKYADGSTVKGKNPSYLKVSCVGIIFSALGLVISQSVDDLCN